MLYAYTFFPNYECCMYAASKLQVRMKGCAKEAAMHYVSHYEKITSQELVLGIGQENLY